MQEPSIFTRIINGEIPSYKVYEDDRVIAFLTIDPITPGHTLVIPKLQIISVWDLPDDLYVYTMGIVKKVASRQLEVLQPKRVGIVVDGFAVPHAHIHVLPLQDGLEAAIDGHFHLVTHEPDNTALADMAKKLYFS
jgi:histidine triad (HIT) family protein